MNVYQIELTSRCNARCSFCPHSKMTRRPGDMDMRTFERTLSFMENSYTALHHFGEPTLNRKLPAMIEMAHEAGVEVEFSTNGGVRDFELWNKILEAEPYIIRFAYDTFRPDDLIKYVLTKNISSIIKLHSVGETGLPERKPFNNFAGAVEGKTEVNGECYFKKYNFAAVLWTGDIVPCCQDFDGMNVLGSVLRNDDVVHMPYYEMCLTCGGMQFADDGLWSCDVPELCHKEGGCGYDIHICDN